MSVSYYYSSGSPSNAYTYQNYLALHTDCNDCKAGKYFQSNTSSTSCTTCSSGYSGTGSASCGSVCSAGYVDATDYLGNGNIGMGSGIVSSKGCYACKPGSYASSSGLSECTACSLGTYSDTTASTGCNSCEYPNGAYVSYTEGPFPEYVDSQYYDSSSIYTGSTTTYVSWGFSVDVYSESITSYTNGFAFEPYGNSDYSFRSNVYISSSSSSSSKSSTGSYHYYKYNAAEVSKIPATTCKACSAGRYWDSGLCQQCPTGKYSSTLGARGSGSCQQCEVGKTTSSVASYVVTDANYNCTSFDLYEYTDSFYGSNAASSSKICFFTNITNDLTSGTTCDKICRWPFRHSFNSAGTVYKQCGTIDSIFALDTPKGAIIAVCLIPVFMFFLCLSMIKDNGVRNMKLTIALGVYFLIPAIDVVSDLLYIQANAFYHLGFFITIASFHLQPAFTLLGMMFHRNWIPKCRIVPLPNFIYYKEYTKRKHYIITGLLMAPFLILNLPVLLPLFIIGVYLFSCKVFAINSVGQVWYELWTGKDDWHRKDVISLETLNESLYAQIAFETLPQFCIQIVNNVLLDNYNGVSYFSTCISGLNLANGLYRMVYYKLYKRIKITQIPLKLAIAGVQILKTDDVIKSRPNSHRLSLRQSINIRKALIEKQLENDEIDLNLVSVHTEVSKSIEMTKLNVVVEGVNGDLSVKDGATAAEKEVIVSDASDNLFLYSESGKSAHVENENADVIATPFGEIDVQAIFEEEEEEYMNVKSATQDKVNLRFELNFVKLDENIVKLRHALLPLKKYSYKQFADLTEIDKIVNTDKKKA